MINKLIVMLIITGEKQIQSITTIKEMLVMSRFCLPRDIYHGKGCLEELKNLKPLIKYLEITPHL